MSVMMLCLCLCLFRSQHVTYLFGLRHVCDDAVGDDEQDAVLAAVARLACEVSHVVDHRRKVGRPVQLDTRKTLLVRLQHACRNARTAIRVCKGSGYSFESMLTKIESYKIASDGNSHPFQMKSEQHYILMTDPTYLHLITIEF